MICERFDQVVDGQRISGFICSDRRRRRCAFCSASSTKLCDGPPRPGSKKKTCDAPLCARHATHLAGHDVDYCPPHADLVRSRIQLEFGLGDRP